MMLSSSTKKALFDFRINGAPGGSLVEQTAAHVRNLILAGKLECGAKIPGVRELALKWPVSYVVIQRALAKCTGENLLTRYPGRGTFVLHNRRPPKNAHCIYVAIQQTEQESAVTDYAASDYFMGFTTGLQKELAGHSVIVMTMTVTGAVQEKMFIARLRANPADIVVFMRSKNTPVLDEISKMNVPLLLVDPHVYPECGFNVISHDEERAAADIINFFIEHGRNKIGLLFLDDGKWVSARRIKSITGALQSRGLALNSTWLKVLKRPGRDQVLPKSLAEMFSGKTVPDALIVSNIDNHSVAVAGRTTGLSIPKNPMVAIYAATPDPSVASLVIVIDGYTYGRAVGRLLYNNFYRKEEVSIPRSMLLPFPVKDLTQ